MLKTILVPLLIVTGLTQTKNLGTQYELNTEREGKIQELTLYKDSFCYKIKGIMELRGRYRVSYDSLILATGSKIPIVFRIQHNKLAGFRRNEPADWCLTKVK